MIKMDENLRTYIFDPFVLSIVSLILFYCPFFEPLQQQITGIIYLPIVWILIFIK